MKLSANRTAILVSLVVPLLSLFFDSCTVRDGIGYSLGLPLDFFTYYSPSGPPVSRLEIFSDFFAVTVRLEYYLIDVLVWFAVIRILPAVVRSRWLAWRNR